MRKLITTLLSGVIIFSLVACGTNNTASNTKTEAATESKAEVKTEPQTVKPTEEATTTAVVETIPETVKPAEEVTTKAEEHYITEQYVKFSYAYITPQTCEKIISLYDGVTLKKGDKIDIADVGFTSSDGPKAKSNFKSKMASGLSSGMSSDSTVLTVGTKQVSIKVSYDNQ